MKSLVLLSGGLDSCVALATAKHECLNPELAMVLQYGQRNQIELLAAIKITDYYNIPLVQADIRSHTALISRASGLLNKEEKLGPKPVNGVSRAYVPGRNSIFLALAQSLAEAEGFDYIITGFTADPGAIDASAGFVGNWNKLAVFATQRGATGEAILINAPLINMKKPEVIEWGVRLLAPIEMTWSCFNNGPKPCEECSACRLRISAFEALNWPDPAIAYWNTRGTIQAIPSSFTLR